MEDAWSEIARSLDFRSQIRLTAVSKELSCAIIPKLPKPNNDRTMRVATMSTWGPLAVHALQKRNPWKILHALRSSRALSTEASVSFLKCAIYHMKRLLIERTDGPSKEIYAAHMRRIIALNYHNDSVYEAAGITIYEYLPEYPEDAEAYTRYENDGTFCIIRPYTHLSFCYSLSYERRLDTNHAVA